MDSPRKIRLLIELLVLLGLGFTPKAWITTTTIATTRRRIRTRTRTRRSIIQNDVGSVSFRRSSCPLSLLKLSEKSSSSATEKGAINNNERPTTSSSSSPLQHTDEEGGFFSEADLRAMAITGNDPLSKKKMTLTTILRAHEEKLDRHKHWGCDTDYLYAQSRFGKSVHVPSNQRLLRILFNDLLSDMNVCDTCQKKQACNDGGGGGGIGAITYYYWWGLFLCPQCAKFANQFSQFDSDCGHRNINLGDDDDDDSSSQQLQHYEPPAADSTSSRGFSHGHHYHNHQKRGGIERIRGIDRRSGERQYFVRWTGDALVNFETIISSNRLAWSGGKHEDFIAKCVLSQPVFDPYTKEPCGPIITQESVDKMIMFGQSTESFLRRVEEDSESNQNDNESLQQSFIIAEVIKERDRCRKKGVWTTSGGDRGISF